MNKTNRRQFFIRHHHNICLKGDYSKYYNKMLFKNYIYYFKMVNIFEQLRISKEVVCSSSRFGDFKGKYFSTPRRTKNILA